MISPWVAGNVSNTRSPSQNQIWFQAASNFSQQLNEVDQWMIISISWLLVSSEPNLAKHITQIGSILGYLSYCNIWVCAFQSNLTCLHALQKRFVSMVTSSQYQANSWPLLQKQILFQMWSFIILI